MLNVLGVSAAQLPKLLALNCTTIGHLLTSKPLEIIAIDFSLLELASDGKENLTVVTDVFSKFTLTCPTKDHRVTTVDHTLTKRWFNVYSLSKCIHCDQEQNFEGELLQHLCHLYGIQKSQTMPYHDQCECFNHTMHNLFCPLPNDKKRKWPQFLL